MTQHISDIIHQLTEIKEMYGDLEVATFDYNYHLTHEHYCYAEVSNVTPDGLRHIFEKENSTKKCVITIS